MSRDNAAAWLVDRHVEEGRGDRLAFRVTVTAGEARLTGAP